MHTVIWG